MSDRLAMELLSASVGRVTDPRVAGRNDHWLVDLVCHDFGGAVWCR